MVVFWDQGNIRIVELSGGFSSMFDLRVKLFNLNYSYDETGI